MSAVEKARAAYIDAAKASQDAFHRLAVRAREARALRAIYLKNKTKKNKAAYLNAKEIRAARYRSAKRAQAKKYVLKAKYETLKKIANKPLRERALAEARATLHIRERGGNNSGAEVMQIIREGGGTGPEAWCGDAVAAWYKRAGSKVVTRAWAAAHAGIWGWFTGVTRLRSLKNLKPGHIVEYVWQHTGLFEEWIDKDAGWFWAIEGNTRPGTTASDSGGGEGVHRVKRNINQVAGAFSPQR
jgi:hypothetical protein